MYDTVNFRLSQSEVLGVDFLAEIPLYLENVGEHNYSGETVITGSLKGFKISITRHQIKIKDGSLCKWYLGDNFQTLGRGDTQRAIESLSDILHIPMSKATVTRLDVAKNIVTKHPPVVYFNHLGGLKYAKRLEEPDGVYYSKRCDRLCFYDKYREQKNKGGMIPELYVGKNVLRYEQRYTKRIASQLKVAEVTGAMLYDEDFYIRLLKRWRGSYKDIQKINDVTINFEVMNTKQHLYKMGVLALVERVGGQMQMLEQIKEAQSRGRISRKQAFDLKRVVDNACKIKEGFTIQSEVIKELDKKIDEVVRYYR